VTTTQETRKKKSWKGSKGAINQLTKEIRNRISANINVVHSSPAQMNLSVGIVVRLVISRETARSQQSRKERTKWIKGDHPRI
jgi:hypothetical protein